MTHAAAAAASGRELILGRYRAVRPLGSGGSGSVWLAVDEQKGREVALKVVPREGKAGVRAEREADAVARLRHPHVARVYSVDRDLGHVYVAYEYVPGITVRDAVRGGRLSDRDAIDVAAQVAEALGHAHANGIIHRDVKPANVLLAETGEIDARLLDFGLALMEGEASLTATGDVPGTLSYISPERLRGEETTSAADVWAVGVMLWEALAGQQLFFSTSPVETASRIAAGAPSLGTVRPDLPRSNVDTVDRALAADPLRRPTAKRLAHELRDAAQAPSRRRAQAPATSRRGVAQRVPTALFAAGFAALATSLLPFFPPLWTAAIAVVVGLAAFWNARLGLLLAIAAPILPLGNVSLGLAAVYASVALVWFGLFWRDARHGLLVVPGALMVLVPGGAALLPLVAARAVGPVRQAVSAGVSVIAAGVLAGLDGRALPFDGVPAPLGLGVAGSDDPAAVAGTLLSALSDHRLLAAEAVVLALATLALPAVRRTGPLGIAAYATLLLPLMLLAPPLVSAPRPDMLPVVGGVLVLSTALALPYLRRGAPSYTRSG